MSKVREDKNLIVGLDIGTSKIVTIVAELLPEGTLKALSAHTELGTIMPADGGDCEEVLDQFAAEGIDVNALAAQLQDDGAKSFVKSWNELMAVISSKGAALTQGAS